MHPIKVSAGPLGFEKITEQEAIQIMHVLWDLKGDIESIFLLSRIAKDLMRRLTENIPQPSQYIIDVYKDWQLIALNEQSPITLAWIRNAWSLSYGTPLFFLMRPVCGLPKTISETMKIVRSIERLGCVYWISELLLQWVFHRSIDLTRRLHPLFEIVFERGHDGESLDVYSTLSHAEQLTITLNKFFDDVKHFKKD